MTPDPFFTPAVCRRAAILVAAVVLAIALPGCSSSAPPGDAGTTDATGSTDAGLPTQCPSTTPAAGSACPRVGLVCGYGDDPRVSCRTSATCQSSGWTLQDPHCATPAACPDLGDAAAGQLCPTMDATCGYGALFCTCTNCGPPFPVQQCDGAPTWHCAAAPTTSDTGCPTSIPNLGTGCAPDGRSCRYDCQGTLTRTCQGGVWIEMPGMDMCPRSNRSLKHDVAYVTDSDGDRLARDLLATRLATYEYDDPAQPGQRLGFVIEDMPQSFAVANDRAHVDLYGYASLLVATVQSQERRIRLLETQIAELRAIGRNQPARGRDTIRAGSR